MRNFNRSAKNLGLVFAPPLTLFTFYVGFIIIRERKAEAGRRERRAKRIEEGGRRSEEARKRTEEKKRKKEKRKRQLDGELEGELEGEISEKAPEGTPKKDPEKAPETARAQVSAKSEPQRRRVLLIDDDAAEVEAVTKNLAESDVGVAHFPNMEHVLAEFAKSGGDLGHHQRPHGGNGGTREDQEAALVALRYKNHRHLGRRRGHYARDRSRHGQEDGGGRVRRWPRLGFDCHLRPNAAPDHRSHQE